MTAELAIDVCITVIGLGLIAIVVAVMLVLWATWSEETSDDR
jgi:hypothetical protein